MNKNYKKEDFININGVEINEFLKIHYDTNQKRYVLEKFKKDNEVVVINYFKSKRETLKYTKDYLNIITLKKHYPFDRLSEETKEKMEYTPFKEELC